MLETEGLSCLMLLKTVKFSENDCLLDHLSLGGFKANWT